MSCACEATGLKFRIGKWRFRFWKYGWEYGDNLGGRMFFWPWRKK